MDQRATSVMPRRGLDLLHAFRQAVAAHNQGRMREAEQLYQTVLEADARHFDALYRLGLLRLQQSRFDDAAGPFRRAVKIAKNSADAQFHLAVALTGLGSLEAAIRHYEKALSIKPQFAEAHNNLGHALQLLGRHQDALTCYEEALAIDPGYAEACNNLGNALQMLDHFEAAIVQYEKALAIRPNYAEAHNNLGNVVAALGRHEEAITHYEKALAIKSKYAEAFHSLGNALAALGRYREAIGQYENALAVCADHAEAYLALGRALAALGRHEEEIARYDGALAIRPKDAGLLAARGHALIRMGENAEAAKVFEGLVKRGERSVEALYALTAVPASMVSIDLLPEFDKVVRDGTYDKIQFERFGAFIRAAALDKAGRRAEAWEQLRIANRNVFLVRREEFSVETARQRSTLQRLGENAINAADRGEDCEQTISVFILGPSRSGKTAMEKLLSALPGVKRGHENAIVENAVTRASQAAALPPGTLFENLPRALHALCRDMYLEELAAEVELAKIFTNTNPVRIHEVDLIGAVLPNVRLILMKRNIEDNVLRIYQRSYKQGNVYAYHLEAARDHVVWYHQVTDLLAEKFPEIVRVIHYEEMIADPTATLRIAADLCGLPMTDGPLPDVGDDRGCAAPYRQFMAAELGSRETCAPALQP